MLANACTAFWLRLKALVRRRELDRDLDDELAFHLAMREQKLREQGLSSEEAPYATRPPVRQRHPPQRNQPRAVGIPLAGDSLARPPLRYAPVAQKSRLYGSWPS